MNPPDLPDDVRQWPRDPYRLLQVDPAADRRTVRQAYTRLVRRYKPEQFPAEFRAIRDAYESVIASLTWREENFHGDDEDAEVEFRDSTGQTAFHEEDPRPLGHEQSLANELDKIWQQAQQGDPQKAYYRLVELAQQSPRDAIYLRLYWLLRIFPQVDGTRSPLDWLVQGLTANRLTGPLRELYRRELEHSPREALGDACRGLLGLQGPPAALVELAGLRWRVAGKLRKWDVLSTDLKRLEPVVRRESEEAWGRLLLSAVEQIAWVTPNSRPPLCEWCVEQIEKLDHMSTALRWVV